MGLRQTNFSAGELDPKLWGRTDLPTFGRGLRRCRNFFPSRHGAAVSRPGTIFVGYARAVATRLVPFIYSDTVSYVLEFTDGWLQIWSYGVFVAAIVSPYLATDLNRLQWAQTGDVVTITHPLYPPKELQRLAHASWQFVDVVFDRPSPSPVITGVVANTRATGFGGDTTHPAREWAWVVTSLNRDSRGVITESAPVAVTKDSGGVNLPNTLAVYQDLPITLRIDGTFNVDPSWITHRVYRGRGGAFGWIGDTKVNTFTDVGEEPDYTAAPPLGRNPFKVYDSTGALVRTEYPSAVAFFEERRFFGGTSQRPGWIFGSATGDYANFDERLVPVDDMALYLELAARTRQEVRTLVGAKRLLAGTNASIWAGGGVGPDPFTFESIDFDEIDQVGTNRLPMPLVVDGAVLFSRTKGSGVRALLYDLGRGGYGAVDLSTIAQHLFLGLTAYQFAWATTPIVDWAYQEDPWGVVWAVRNDGTMVSLTYQPGADIWGWGRHDFDQGKVLSVCSVPEGEEDVVYVAVARTILGSAALTTIEKFSSRVHKGGYDKDANGNLLVSVLKPTIDDICVDCALMVPSAAPALQLTLPTTAGTCPLEGKTVYVVSQNNPVYGPFVVAGGKVTLPELPKPNNPLHPTEWVGWVGLLYTAEIETLDLAQGDVRVKQKTVVSVGAEVDQSRGLWFGPDFDNLVEWRQRTPQNSYNSISAATDLIRLPISAGWEPYARLALRQTMPLPVTVLGLTRELDIGS